ncbi:MAG: hypothetical protein ACI8P3_001674 [Saprospiraceae bacterium]|jgi:hypothetical protein
MVWYYSFSNRFIRVELIGRKDRFFGTIAFYNKGGIYEKYWGFLFWPWSMESLP